MLRGKSLEEIINKWTAELEANVREFNRFGAEVAVWDRALIENGNNVSLETATRQIIVDHMEQIAALYSHVLAAEKQQNEINDSLNHIEQQQRDLASTLDAYEKISQEILGGQGSTLRTLDTGPADNERDKKYGIVLLSLFSSKQLIHVL
jgi:nuclear pore complex protein Nup62